MFWNPPWPWCSYFTYSVTHSRQHWYITATTGSTYDQQCIQWGHGIYAACIKTYSYITYYKAVTKQYNVSTLCSLHCSTWYLYSDIYNIQIIYETLALIHWNIVTSQTFKLLYIADLCNSIHFVYNSSYVIINILAHACLCTLVGHFAALCLQDLYPAAEWLLFSISSNVGGKFTDILEATSDPEYVGRMFLSKTWEISFRLQRHHIAEDSSVHV